MPLSQEQCRSCLQAYAYEVEVRCVHCDGPACPFCAVRVESTWVCLDCEKETSDGRARDVEG